MSLSGKRGSWSWVVGQTVTIDIVFGQPFARRAHGVRCAPSRVWTGRRHTVWGSGADSVHVQVAPGGSPTGWRTKTAVRGSISCRQTVHGPLQLGGWCWLELAAKAPQRLSVCKCPIKKADFWWSGVVDHPFPGWMGRLPDPSVSWGDRHYALAARSIRHR